MPSSAGSAITPDCFVLHLTCWHDLWLLDHLLRCFKEAHSLLGRLDDIVDMFSAASQARTEQVEDGHDIRGTRMRQHVAQALLQGGHDLRGAANAVRHSSSASLTTACTHVGGPDCPAPS